MIAAAAMAPDHGQLRPYRFIYVACGARPALAEAFSVAEQEANPPATSADLARARERALHAPALLAVIARLTSDHPNVPIIEQYASAGAALGYLLLAANSMGFGAMAVSGEKARSQSVRVAFDLAPNEHLLCFAGLALRPRSVLGDPAQAQITCSQGGIALPARKALPG